MRKIDWVLDQKTNLICHGDNKKSWTLKYIWSHHMEHTSCTCSSGSKTIIVRKLYKTYNLDLQIQFPTGPERQSFDRIRWFLWILVSWKGNSFPGNPFQQLFSFQCHFEQILSRSLSVENLLKQKNIHAADWISGEIDFVPFSF